MIKGLLGSNTIIENGVKALDKIVLTEEEKLDLKLEFVKATMPMNRARRIIATVVTAVWASSMGVSTYLLLTESALASTYLQFAFTNISAPFTVIVGFYFWKKVTEAKFSK